MATRTAAQRRDEARSAYDAFLRDCPANPLLGRLGDKWVGLIAGALSGPLSAVKVWAETHFDRVHEARERYDGEAAA
ncbi:hypothetical protein ACH4LT_13630 [Streptomyces clavifer]|uniref:hypothetical protein n=1 Tax=Streptomyces clavifer TaxID=68188 RepID=UPI00379A9B71